MNSTHDGAAAWCLANIALALADAISKISDPEVARSLEDRLVAMLEDSGKYECSDCEILQRLREKHLLNDRPCSG
ncbi:MAG: hypothetical protein JJ959_07955 [Nisaea sp.]|uniref:hypothetical protein n=1 Tax=Nisaea sp. TaxID=2024842 RepID=UPI001B2B1388|nr:hypothetical protein [Nisaea sp.]MBO6560454.1 hypothetical protein [Nisaea sp.]